MSTKHFIQRDPEAAGGIVMESERSEGEVKFFPRGGGFQMRMPADEFEATFRELSVDELNELDSRFKAVVIGSDMIDSLESALPAWSNGVVWNGWAMPVFSKQTILSPAGDLFFRNEWSRSAYDEKADAFVLLTSNDSKASIVTDTDFTELFAQLAETGATYIDSYMIGGHEFEVVVHPGEDLTLEDGSVVRGYAVGSGSWCWEDWTDYDPAAEAAESPAP